MERLCAAMDLKDDEQQHQGQKTPISLTLRNVILALGLIAIATYWSVQSFSEPGGVLYGLRISSRPYSYGMRYGPATFEDKAAAGDECDLHDPNEDPLPAIRTIFGGRGTIVYGWPSSGGVWVHADCYAVELDFLCLSRFKPSDTERFSPAEDDFCQRLEMIGAHFYEREYDYNIQTYTYNHSRVWYAWPENAPTGGVWVLRTTGWEGAELGVARIRNALTMEERCKAIEMLGGKFYEQWDDAKRDTLVWQSDLPQL